MKWDPISRRHFLQGMGRFSLSLPFLPSLLVKEALAQNTNKPSLVFISGTDAGMDTWAFPMKNGPGFQNNVDGSNFLSQTIPGTRFSWDPLSRFTEHASAPFVSDTFGPVFNQHADKMILFRGLDVLPATQHSLGSQRGNIRASETALTLSGTQSWATVDQFIAQQAEFKNSGVRVDSLLCNPGQPNSFSFPEPPNPSVLVENLPAIVDPRAAFNAVFNVGNLSPRNISIVDLVLQEYRSLRQSNRRLSSEDKVRLDGHIDFIADLDSRVRRGPNTNPACTVPNRPNSYPNANELNLQAVEDSYRLMVDIIAASIRCGYVRVACLDVQKGISSNSVYHHVFNGLVNGWHFLAHDIGNAASAASMKAIHQWMANELFARMISALDDPSSDGTLIVFNRDLSRLHDNLGVPTAMAVTGQLQSKFNLGRMIDYSDWGAFRRRNLPDILTLGTPLVPGAPINWMYNTVLQAMGFAPNRYERVPGRGWGETALIAKPGFPTTAEYNDTGNILVGAFTG